MGSRLGSQASGMFLFRKLLPAILEAVARHDESRCREKMPEGLDSFFDAGLEVAFDLAAGLAFLDKTSFVLGLTATGYADFQLD